MKTTETQLKKQIKSYLSWHGWFVFSILQGIGSYKGVSDMIAIKDGVTLFIEVKRPNGRQSDYQKMFEKEIKSHGGQYIVARCLEDIEKY